MSILEEDQPLSIWGGLIDIILSTQGGVEKLHNDPQLKSYYESLQEIERTTTVEDVVVAICEISFTENERNYLNSPLLDQLTTVMCMIERLAAVSSHDPIDSAIGYAASSGSILAVKFLLDRGAILNHDGDGEWESPLNMAVDARHTETALFLLDRGASITSEYCNTLEIACQNDDIQTVNLLLEYRAKIDAGMYNALYEACYNGKIELVNAFLTHGADIHADDNNALSLASENGHIEIVRLLLDHGADIHADDDRALRHACMGNYDRNNIEVVRLLLKHGANVQAVNNCPLKLALNQDDYEMAQLLISYGARLAMSEGIGEPDT